MTEDTFTVDTQLFRELGDLLVGKESTALAELVKNAYDADARTVSVIGTDLSDPDRARIIISDDGVGMDEKQFRAGFLTIAGRSKSSANARSSVFQRRVTGEKGVGRLAARKLARRIEIESRPYRGEKDRAGKLLGKPIGILATIDWDLIEKCLTLQEVAASGAIQVQTIRSRLPNPFAGTTIRLGPLRRGWDSASTGSFLAELGTIRPWPPVIAPPPPAYGNEMLFEALPITDSKREPGFQVHLQGDLERVDPPKAADPNSSSWMVEIDCDTSTGKITYALAPSRTFLREKGVRAARQRLSIPISATMHPHAAVTFKARVYERHEKTWDRSVSGVRVFMEGFRVLPYGDQQDDWLRVDEDYTERSARGLLPTLKGLDGFLPAGIPGESTSFKRNSSYMGAVALTKAGAPNLEMLVNREGFVPGPQFEWLRKHVRIGIDLMSRMRYAATYEMTRARREHSVELRAAAEKDMEQPPSVLLLRDRAREAVVATSQAREALARVDVSAAEGALRKLASLTESVAVTSEEMGAEQAMFRVLASVGTQLEAFSHEINSLLELSNTIRKQIDRFSKTAQLSREHQRFVATIQQRMTDLHHALERQAIFLTDVGGLEARRRRSRLAFRDRFESAIRLLRSPVERNGITVENELSSDLKSPPMFPAEAVALFTNLLSNAIKAAGSGGRIRVRGRSTASETIVVLENTGIAVDLDDAEKWFEPFKSTSASPDAVLGQGMGMGLTIVRSLLDEYGAEVQFVPPSRGFATAIQMRFPTR